MTFNGISDHIQGINGDASIYSKKFQTIYINPISLFRKYPFLFVIPDPIPIICEPLWVALKLVFSPNPFFTL
jgi:hypothetical protein